MKPKIKVDINYLILLFPAKIKMKLILCLQCHKFIYKHRSNHVDPSILNYTNILIIIYT